MKTVFSVLVLFAASVICFSDAFGQTYIQEYLPEGAKARIGKGRVNELAYSPDNTLLAVASTIGIWIYDARSGEALKLLTEHTESVGSIAFSPDGQSLVGGSDDGTLRLWDVRTGASMLTLKGHTGSVRSVVFSPDGRTLASGGHDKTIRLWDPDAGKRKATLTGHTDRVYSIAFSPDGQSLASGGRDELIRIWDVRTGELLRTFAGHAGYISTVAYALDGEVLATHGADGKTYLWHPKTGEFLKALEQMPEDIVSNSRWVYSIAYSPDSTTLACGVHDGTVRLWDIRTGRPKLTLTRHLGAHTTTDAALKTVSEETRQVASVVFSPSGDTLAGSSDDGTIHFWDIATGISQHVVTGHTARFVRSVMYASHGRVLACARLGSIELWEPHTGTLIKTINSDVNRWTSVAYSPDNVTFAYGDFKTVWLLDTNVDEHNKTALTGHEGRITSVDFSPDGSILASSSADKTICLWDVVTGDLRNVFGHTGKVQHVVFSPTGQTLASTSEDGTIRIWDINTGDVIKSLVGHDSGVGHVAFSPTGQTLASTNDDDTIRIWDISTGETIKTITPASDTSYFIAYSPDGNTLACVVDRINIHLWNVHSGALLRTFTGGHVGYISSIVFSPDGRTLTSGSSGGTVLLWEITR